MDLDWQAAEKPDDAEDEKSQRRWVLFLAIRTRLALLYCCTEGVHRERKLARLKRVLERGASGPSVERECQRDLQ